MNEHIKQKKQIGLAAVISYITVAFATVSGLVYTPWVINQIGQSQYGIYVLLTELIGFFMMDFGLSISVQRYVAKYYVEGDQESINSVVGLVFKVFLFLAVVLAVVFLVYSYFLDKIYIKLSAEEIASLRSAYTVFAVYSVATFPFLPANGVLLGYERLVFARTCDLLYKILTVAFVVASLLYGLELNGLIVGHAMASVLVVLIRILYVYKKTSLRIRLTGHSKEFMKEMTGFTLWLSVQNIAQRLTLAIMPQILGAVAGTSDTAQYGVAYALYSYGSVMITAVNSLFMTYGTRVFCERGEQGFVILAKKIGRIQMSLALLIVLGFTLVGRQFIVLWVGDAYQDVYACTIMLFITSILGMATYLADIGMIIKKQTKPIAIASVISMLVSVPLSIVLGMKYGAIGVSISYLVSYIVRCLVLVKTYRKHICFNMMRFFYDAIYTYIVPSIITVTVYYALHMIVLENNVLDVAFRIAIVAVSYCIFVYCIGMNRETRKAALNCIKTRRFFQDL